MKGGGSSVIRRPTTEKSNVELINALRSNFQASQQLDSTPSANGDGASIANGNGSHGANGNGAIGYKSWTSEHNGTLYIPALDFSQPGLAEERTQYDITVKLFYLPGIPASRRCAHTREAIDLVLKELGVDSIDLLIVSFPGILFDAEDDSEDEDEDGEGEGEGGEAEGNREEEEQPDDFDSMVQTWHTLEEIQGEGMISQLGVAEFGSERLAKFLAYTNVKPSVDQINLKDCCVVPKSLILYAKQERIQLLTHNDCNDILPVGTTRELLGPESGVGILASAPGAGDGEIGEGEVEPQWVVKYTAVVKDRGVVENKGYFALADAGTCVEARQDS